MLHREVIKNHKKAPPNLVADINKEAKLLASKEKTEDRIEKFNIKNCFITLKDHNGDFRRNPTYRLINPTNTSMGKISKIILQGSDWVQSQVKLYQRLKKWYLMPPCLTLSIIRYVSRVKWSNPGKGGAPSPTPRCGSYWKCILRVTLFDIHNNPE